MWEIFLYNESNIYLSDHGIYMTKYSLGKIFITIWEINHYILLWENLLFIIDNIYHQEHPRK